MSDRWPTAVDPLAHIVRGDQLELELGHDAQHAQRDHSAVEVLACLLGQGAHTAIGSDDLECSDRVCQARELQTAITTHARGAVGAGGDCPGHGKVRERSCRRQCQLGRMRRQEAAELGVCGACIHRHSSLFLINDCSARHPTERNQLHG